MSDDPCFLSAGELRRQIGRKEISPLEITRAVLARAERLQPELNCFIEICADRALAEAKDAERRIMAGDPLRGLEGIPFTVKDIVNTKDVRTTFGAIPYRDNVPDHDAVAVARLRAAGAILIGKTTTPEFGTKCLTDSPLFGRTRNAWSGGRLERRRSGGGRERHCTACGGNRWRWFDPHPGRLQRRCRAEAEQWRDPPQSGAGRLRQSDLCHPDHPHGRRHRADDAGHGRRGCVRSLVDRNSRSGFYWRCVAAWRPQREANSVLPRAARPQGFRRCRGGVRCKPENARSA